MGRFADSYLGRLRALVGDRLILVPGACIVIEREDGKLLLQRRTDFDLWGLLAGIAEENESLPEMIAREVAEETGVVIANPKPFGFSGDPRQETFTYPNGHRCHFFSLAFYTREFTGEPEIRDDESLELGWFAVDALPEMLPNMRRIVEGYQRFLATGEFQMI
jgi:ADP-ribose pyrophosphatase YjhB (NUDIX family)